MERITYEELKKKFRNHEATPPYPKEPLTGFIVFTEDSFAKFYFAKFYSLESRTYKVRSDNKAFQPNKRGYSIFVGNLDGTDPGVCLEQYMAEERGGKDGWKVDYCYLEE